MNPTQKCEKSFYSIYVKPMVAFSGDAFQRAWSWLQPTSGDRLDAVGQAACGAMDQQSRTTEAEAGGFRSLVGRVFHAISRSRLVTAVKWLAGKIWELPQLRKTDLHLARAEAFAQNHKLSEEHKVIPIADIDMIHPINRESAEQKTEARRQAARQAGELIEGNEETLTEEMIRSNRSLSAFQSITGICVVRHEDRYYALEGNGRIAALRDVYPQLRVEVREYAYSEEDHAELLRLIERARQSNGIAATI